MNAPTAISTTATLIGVERSVGLNVNMAVSIPAIDAPTTMRLSVIIWSLSMPAIFNRPTEPNACSDRSIRTDPAISISLSSSGVRASAY